MWENSDLFSLYLNKMDLLLSFDKSLCLYCRTKMRKFALQLGLIFDIFASCFCWFARTLDYCCHIITASQLLVREHHILENNEFQNKVERKFSSKNPFSGCILYFRKNVFQWLSLVSHKGKVSQMPNLMIFITVFLPDILGKFLEAAFWRDSSFIHLYIRFWESFLLKLYVCCAGKLQNPQILLRKWQILINI